MKLGEIFNGVAAQWGRPLDGVRVLALEQYIALPIATQMLQRLGAEVIKIEPLAGEPGRSALPAVTDSAGRKAGASFLRHNLGKQSVVIDINCLEGQEIVQSLAERFDVVCENLGPGRAHKLGLGYDALAERNPKLVYLSVSGFGRIGESPWASRPAMAGVAEAISGAYEFARRPHQAPVAGPFGPLGDTVTGVFAALGVVAALRHRDQIGIGQFVDVAMVDSMIALCDFVPNFWSLGVRKREDGAAQVPGLIGICSAADGWFSLYVLRPHQFVRLSTVVGHLEWLDNVSLTSPWDWARRADDLLCPAISAWARTLLKRDAVQMLADAGVPAAPCNSAEDLVTDPHVHARRMLIEVQREDGVAQPILVAGNPIKMSRVAEGPERRHPLLSEHTDSVLAEELGFSKERLQSLRRTGSIG